MLSLLCRRMMIALVLVGLLTRTAIYLWNSSKQIQFVQEEYLNHQETTAMSKTKTTTKSMPFSSSASVGSRPTTTTKTAETFTKTATSSTSVNVPSTAKKVITTTKAPTMLPTTSPPTMPTVRVSMKEILSSTDETIRTMIKEWWNYGNTSKVSTIIGSTMVDDYPVTRFTSHVLNLVQNYPIKQVTKCPQIFNLRLLNSNEKLLSNFYPRYDLEDVGHQRWSQIVLGHMLNQSIHPERKYPIANITIGFAITDYVIADHPQRNWACLASSSNHNGSQSFVNFLEVKRWAKRQEYKGKDWNERSSIPVFRGTGHGPMSGLEVLAQNESTHDQVLPFILNRCYRCRAVQFSYEHPELADVRLHAPLGEVFNKPYKKAREIVKQQNQTSLLELDPIHGHIYYGDYQSAMVLCGIGAAFRTAIHMSTETAVVLQDCPHVEWFTPLLVPWKHYIPLDYELTELYNVTTWMQEHPQQVYEIAQYGKQFYDDWLSFEQNEEHLYEILIRLSMKNQYEKEIRNNRWDSLPES